MIVYIATMNNLRSWKHIESTREFNIFDTWVICNCSCKPVYAKLTMMHHEELLFDKINDALLTLNDAVNLIAPKRKSISINDKINKYAKVEDTTQFTASQQSQPRPRTNHKMRKLFRFNDAYFTLSRLFQRCLHFGQLRETLSIKLREGTFIFSIRTRTSKQFV